MFHPRAAFAQELALLEQSAAALGYRMPAEWAPLARVWVAPPHNRETWPGCLPQAQAQFAAFLEALARCVDVADVTAMGIATNDSWIRDYGPIFVSKGPGAQARGQADGRLVAAPQVRLGESPGRTPEAHIQASSPPSHASGRASHPAAVRASLAIHDFRFNAWGGKYEGRQFDDIVPQHIARRRNLPLWIHDLVLEGGSIDVNGAGTLMTTSQCLLNPNRNPHLTRPQIEERLRLALGVEHIIFLPGGIIGDDTDGHIDDIARFIRSDTVVCLRAPAGHPDHDMLDANYQALRQARDQSGHLLTLVELPVPEPIIYDFPADRFGHAGPRPIPASYANFLIANGGLFLPVFGQASDDLAIRTLQQALPTHRIIPLRAEHLVVGLGAFHCLTQQEPAAPSD